jgi:archaellum component FlaC
MKTRLIPLFFSLPLALHTQPSVFNGRIVDERSQRGVANLAVRALGYGEDRTNDDGIFRVTLPAGVNEVQIILPPGWNILFPREGRALVPRSNALVVFSVKSNREEDEMIRRQMERLKHAGKLKDVQIDSLQTQLRRAAETYQEQLNSREAEMEALRHRLQSVADSLERLFLARNRIETYDELSRDLLAFSDKLKDVHDQLGGVRDAFLHPEAMRGFNAAVERYNQAREILLEQHKGYVEKVGWYWNNAHLAAQVETLCDFALHTIHRQAVLPLQSTVVEPMREYATGRKSRLAVQGKAGREAQKTRAALTPLIQMLDEKIESLLPALRRPTE